ncbi:MAG: hypothetical protein ACXWQR_17750, partial [Ktedonobacterales bacterium]
SYGVLDAHWGDTQWKATRTVHNAMNVSELPLQNAEPGQVGVKVGINPLLDTVTPFASLRDGVA